MEIKRSYVTYEDFGAVGDGVHDDMPAIVAAHEYANENRLPVKARDDAHYYIGGKPLTAKIMTSTDFGRARFTIDDRDVENIKLDIFNVVSGYESFTPEISSVLAGQKKIDFPHEGTVLVKVYSNEGKVYIRKGLNKDSGSDPSEVFVVDGDGNILTDINWNYSKVSAVTAKRVDDEPIVIEGGIFTTIANTAPSKYTYYNRGILVTRSCVTLKSFTHYIEGEGDHGAPYSGFLNIANNYNVTLDSCILSPHKTYWTESQVPGKLVPMGTYDLLFGFTIGTKLINIKQVIDINDSTYWGLMGSNGCKDMTLDGCVMSRFDAHCGVTNATITNCDLGFAGLNLIGFGECLIENTTIRTNTFIWLRADYGSFFAGKLTIRNCTHKARNSGTMCLIWAHNDGGHDFGYPCMMPPEIEIDGLTIDDEAAGADAPYVIFSDFDADYSEGKPYPYEITKKMTVRGIKRLHGTKIALAAEPKQFEKLILDYKK